MFIALNIDILIKEIIVICSKKITFKFYQIFCLIVFPPFCQHLLHFKNLKDIEFYITSFLDSQKADFSSTVTAYNIGFLKNRDSKILDYTLQNYGLLIEKEFDTLDYSLMSATHLNWSLKEKSNFLKPEEYKNMIESNFCKIKYSNSKKCLFKLLKKFGLSLEVIRMIDILYNKGILTSKDIIEALKENAEEQ